MLSKKQQLKLNSMVRNYESRVLDTHRAEYHIIKEWSQRYRGAMERVLQKQGKS